MVSCASHVPVDKLSVAQAPSRAEKLETKRTPTGQILIRPLINGQDLGWFIFDTGAAGMAIAPSAADRAMLGVLESKEVQGAGGSATKRVRGNATIDLGPVHVDDVSFIELEELDNPLATLAFGQPVAGVCGYEVLRAGVFAIDPSVPSVTAIAGETPSDSAVTWHELAVFSGHPHLRCSFEGDHEALFMLDTGFNGAVSFTERGVKEYSLLEGRKLRRSMAIGVGGARADRHGTIEWLEFGGHRVNAVQAGFESKNTGLDDARLAGMIGMKIMGNYKLVWDYPRGRLGVALPTKADGSVNLAGAKSEHNTVAVEVARIAAAQVGEQV